MSASCRMFIAPPHEKYVKDAIQFDDAFLSIEGMILPPKISRILCGIKDGLIKPESHGSIHFPFVPSAALARCIEGANGKYSPRTDLIKPSLGDTGAARHCFEEICSK